MVSNNTENSKLCASHTLEEEEDGGGYGGFIVEK